MNFSFIPFFAYKSMILMLIIAAGSLLYSMASRQATTLRS